MAYKELRPLLPTALFPEPYATPDNVAKEILYINHPPQLQEAAAIHLKRANMIFNSKGLLLVVLDGLRTEEAHAKLLAVNSNPMYVNPKSGHLEGWSVDATLANLDGEHLDMGTQFDEFVKKSHVGAKRLKAFQEMNRALLSGVMASCGFRQLPSEWWHFDLIEELRTS